MTDSQTPERPAGSLDAEEPGQEPAKSQELTAAPAVREAWGALTAVQGKQSSGDNWGTGEASAAGEMPHPSAEAPQQTAASAVTQAAGPLVAGLKRAVASVVDALESFFEPSMPADWMYTFPLIGERETGDDLNTVLRFLQSAGHHPRSALPGRPVIERKVELKSEAGSNVIGSSTIRLVEETHTDNCKA
ncbi:uncharacterized protein EMH_0013280 [Eimeria mitis]|uniref:Uncharacterized protein n=1 Tax=Eimeria mitis TaxID=44415 RepID=U6K4R0_9EIME|nr:uncharacterized protein EMH_0013280 [Eimeria mitis]CDJ32674.1 hypothetical protein EMH_0013280 [Eimeria mitis]